MPEQHERTVHGDQVVSAAKAKSLLAEGVGVAGHWNVVARDPSGREKWRDTIPMNLVTNEGLDHLLDVTLSNATQVSTWYVGLIDGSPTIAAGDTMSSHAGWTEVTAYDEGASPIVRPTWTDGGVSSQSVDNSGNTATFTINSDSTTVGGAFLVSDNTVGGTSGTLYAAGAFSAGNKGLDTNDTLDVTATFTTAAA